MGIVVLPDFGADPVSITGPGLDAKVNPLATEFNGGIDNDNVDPAAGIGNAKLNLASIAQNVSFAGTVALTGVNTISGITTMSGKIFKLAKGADVASLAGTITLGDDGNYFDITGTNAITSITAKAAGTVVVLQFDSTASLVDGSNLKIAGNFTGAAESQIMLSSDGTNWFEVSRSPGATLTAATQAQMEAATSNVVTVTPLAVNWHPGVAKAWAVFNGSGTPTMAASYNTDSSITDNGVGDYTLSWTTDFSSANYAYSFSAFLSGARGLALSSLTAGAAAGTLRFITTDTAFSGIDATTITVTAFGDQ